MEFLGVPLYDQDFVKLGVKLSLNVFFVWIIVRYAISRRQMSQDFIFTAVMMNVTVFFICFTLKKLDIGLGMALGLFAIFGVLRYRTEAISIKEMTYLFIVIGIAVINALSNKKTSYAELLAVNAAIFAATLVMEFLAARHSLSAASTGKTSIKTLVEYDKLHLLDPSKSAELTQDLRDRLGIQVSKVQIRNIDLKKSVATLTVWFNAPPKG